MGCDLIPAFCLKKQPLSTAVGDTPCIMPAHTEGEGFASSRASQVASPGA